MKSTLSLFGVSLMFIVHFLGAEPLSSKDLQSAKKIINNLCIACHGADGNSAISVNPKLAGQHAAYITKQLMNFKSGKRDNAVMAGMVATLTEQDMINLGTYFSNQKITLSMAKENGIDSVRDALGSLDSSARRFFSSAVSVAAARRAVPRVTSAVSVRAVFVCARVESP